MFKLKKHPIALTIGALMAAPAFADVSTEGIIYQADQTEAQANINQVSVDALPQAAAVIQIDSSATGNTAVHNIGTVIQGAVSGIGGVTIDPTGATATNLGSAAFDGSFPGTTLVTPPTITDLSAYTDQTTGEAPYAYTIFGTDSNNYGLVLQDGQQHSQGVIIQATGLESTNAIAVQDSLTNPDLLANADAETAAATLGGTLSFTLQDYNNAAAAGQGPVVVNYDDGLLTINYDGANDVQIGGGLFAEPTNAEGNLAFVQQGGELVFSMINNGGVDIDAIDSFVGTGDSNNLALVIQDATNSYASVGQQGSLNSVVVLQNGDNNAAESYQFEDALGSPTSNYSLIAQVGNFNLAQTYQQGTTNSAYVWQLGDGNISEVDQAANGAIAFVYQSNSAGGGAAATGNYASIYQHSL